MPGAGPLDSWMNWTTFWLIVVLISLVVSCISSSNNYIEVTFLTGWWVLSAFALQVVRSNKMEMVDGQRSTLGQESCLESAKKSNNDALNILKSDADLDL